MTPFDPSRTLFIGIGMSAPCWYRCALPAMQLGAEWCGVRGEAPKLQFVTGASTRALDVEELFSYDTVVLQQPRGAGWLKLIRRLQAAGVTVLFEIDDDVHAVRKIASHAHRGTYGKNYVRDIELNMRACDGLIVATEFLAQRYRPLNPRVWVCRNGLDLGRFDLTPPGNGDQVTIGWAGGTGHEEAVRPWLQAIVTVMQERPSVRFMSAGEPYGDLLIPHFGSQRALSLPFIEIDTYPAALTNFDIAIAPAGRTNFHRGKSDLRWLEASALGIPIVADPFVYADIQDGVTGLLAEDPDQAKAALLRLVDDEAERRRIGAAARAHVREHRSIAAMAPQWTQALAEAGERHEALAAG
jgi:glycosyltransferase involved in cell wall biosynthesis